MNLFAIVRTSMAIASLTLVATPIHAQSTPATLANDVLAAYQKGNADEFANLVTASSLLDNTTTLSAQIKTNIETLLDIYGPVEGGSWSRRNLPRKDMLRIHISFSRTSLRRVWS